MQQNHFVGRKWFQFVFALLFVLTLLAPVKNIHAQDPIPPDDTNDWWNPLGNQVFLPIAYVDYCPNFMDDFSNPDRGWSNFDDEMVNMGVVDGEYQIRTKRSGYLYQSFSPACLMNEYYVETDVRWSGPSGAYYGLVFGYKSETDFYVFEVNSDYQMFDVYHYTPNGWIGIILLSETSVIYPGNQTNHLEVKYENLRPFFYINGRYVGQILTDTSSNLSQVGVFVTPYSDSPQAEARFDNFRRRSPWTITSGPSTITSPVLPRELQESEIPDQLRDMRRAVQP
jgi:hypothetical protein